MDIYTAVIGIHSIALVDAGFFAFQSKDASQDPVPVGKLSAQVCIVNLSCRFPFHEDGVGSAAVADLLRNAVFTPWGAFAVLLLTGAVLCGEER